MRERQRSTIGMPTALRTAGAAVRAAEAPAAGAGAVMRGAVRAAVRDVAAAAAVAFLAAAFLLLVASPALALAATFSDVPATHPNAVAIAHLSDQGIITGFQDGTFHPDQAVSRQQFAKMIVKTLGLTVTGSELCPFTDVAVQQGADPFYPSKYVAVCAASGITTGKTPTTFAPTESITRQQLITMVVRAAQLPDPPATYLFPFSSTQFSLDDHYRNARKAFYAGLLDGLPGIGSEYDFTAPTTRGVCAQVLYNLLFSLEQGKAIDLIHFWWDWYDWQDMDAENISQVAQDESTGSTGSAGAKIIGETYYFDDLDFPATHICATGEKGDLLVFSCTQGGWNWKVRHLPSPSGRRLRGLQGGRAFNAATAVTEVGGSETLHVFATDADDNLIHYWLPPGGSWQAENVSAATGQKMTRMGWACTWEDPATVQVVGTSLRGELLHFWLVGDQTWHAENVSEQTGRTIKGEASFNWDGAAGLGTAVVAAGPNDELLIFHHPATGPWTVEDVTAATATATTPGVTLGGWLSWWSWGGDDEYWYGSQFHNAVAVLDPAGHFKLLERASGAAPWTVADVSALIWQTFRADTGGDSILVFYNPPDVPTKEAHFAGVNQSQDLIHFWRDTAGTWHSENMSQKASQKVAYPVNYYAWWEWTDGYFPTVFDYVCCIAPNGDLVFLWDHTTLRDWQVFNATAVTGYKVKPPELPWWSGSSKSHLALALPE